MRIIQDIELARSTLLKRLPLELEESPGLRRRIKEVFQEELTPQQAVERIVADVRARGDAALFDWGRRLDGVELSCLEASREEIAAAYTRVAGEVVAALELAVERIASFHRASRRQSWLDFAEGGLGQIVRPLERVGVYAPGGTACYPSTVLMTAVPARVAGVTEVILATPPGRDGLIPAPTLVAADKARVDRVFKVGGAQAIAALAFGTESVPRVDKVCGPGNIFVTLAKRMVYGAVAIDGLQGPTETVIVADDSADPALCAADLLAQAEHDLMATAILITPSQGLAERVSAEVERQLASLERRGIAAEALEGRGGIIVAADLDEAFALVNSYAPEHVALLMADAWSYVGKVRNAGGIFLGEGSPEALGDYIAGPSHVMPTGGTARFSSPLGVDDFLKLTSLVALNAQALRQLGPAAAAIARVEGLSAHARAVTSRLYKL